MDKEETFFPKTNKKRYINGDQQDSTAVKALDDNGGDLSGSPGLDMVEGEN